MSFKTLQVLNTVTKNLNSLKNRCGGLQLTNSRWESNKKGDTVQVGNQGTSKNDESEITLPPEPTYCCMSGCSNCVWIKYAQELAQLFENGDVIAKNKIMEKVPDPKLRTFLFTQLGLKENDTKN